MTGTALSWANALWRSIARRRMLTRTWDATLDDTFGG